MSRPPHRLNMAEGDLAGVFGDQIGGVPKIDIGVRFRTLDHVTGWHCEPGPDAGDPCGIDDPTHHRQMLVVRSHE